MTKRLLDPAKNSSEASSLIQSFNRIIVGQDEAVEALVDVVEHHHSGFSDKTRPAGSLLFLGPTGTGKTRVVEALAHGLFHNEKAMIKVDCAEFQHSHEIAKLTGSPPGYLGHRETPPLFTQERLNSYQTETLKLGIILFDEIEKASDALWQLLLGILDKATITLGTNAQVDFSNQIIIMTSNLGSTDMSKMVDGGIGYQTNAKVGNIDAKLNTTAINAAKKKFTAEFFNRIDRVIVFKTLTKEQIKKVLMIELGQVQTRLQLSEIPFLMHVDESVKKAILDEGYSAKYGARELRRVIRKRIQSPLSRLSATGQIEQNDIVFIEALPSGEFEFSIECRVPEKRDPPKTQPVLPLGPATTDLMDKLRAYKDIPSMTELRPCGCRVLRGWTCKLHEKDIPNDNKR